MPATPKVTYQGIVLGGSRVFDWDDTSGTSPVDKGYTISIERVEQLQPYLGEAGELRIEVEGKKPLVRENIWFIELLPAADPYSRIVRLVDERWLWPKTRIVADFNVRRATGDLQAFNKEVPELSVIQDDIKYAKYSINGDVKWSAAEVVKEIMDRIGPFRIDDEIPDLDVENLIIDDDGDAAIERLLEYLPGFNVYLDAEAVTVFYDTRSGKERDVFKGITRPQLVGGQAIVLDKSAIRPALVRVWFTPFVETRLDYDEGTEGVQDEDSNNVTNVAPAPDLSTTLANGKEVARGTWVPLQDLFDAWGKGGFRNRQMSFAILRKTVLRHGAAGFVHEFGSDPGSVPDPIWLRRAETVLHHWRRTFQVNTYFWGRLLSLMAMRPQVLNTQNGAFAPAEVYSDWVRRPSQRGLAKLKANPNKNAGWIARGYNAKIADANPIPAKVFIEDAESGVITVEPQLDPYGLVQFMQLGYPLNGVIPSQDLGAANRLKVEQLARWETIELEADWRMSLLLTVVPGAPNNSGRLHFEDVAGPDGSNGPSVEARVHPGVLAAYYGWADSVASTTIASIKGEGSLNRATVLNPVDLRNVAKAVAARIYDTLADRPVGSVTIDMDPDIMPTGSLSSVRHVMQDGATFSRLNFTQVTQAVDIWRYLDASTRRVILHTLHQGGVR